MTAPVSTREAELEREVELLRRRVGELEQQLLATERWGAVTVARAQESLYWLERWGVDLNSVMNRRGADELRTAFRAVRALYRRAVRLRRRLLGRR